MNEDYYQDDDSRLWGRGPSDALAERLADADPKGIDAHAPGAKLDAGKPDASLLQQFPRALLEVARVGTYGAQKYSRGGWLSVDDGVNRYTAAMLRHFMAEPIEGPFDQDPVLEEYGYAGKIRHAAQVAWNALARFELMLIEEEQNERR